MNGTCWKGQICGTIGTVWKLGASQQQLARTALMPTPMASVTPLGWTIQQRVHVSSQHLVARRCALGGEGARSELILPLIGARTETQMLPRYGQLIWQTQQQTVATGGRGEEHDEIDRLLFRTVHLLYIHVQCR